ncbi:MAG: M1 family metallopeptidase, partial [Chloroflexi bacterium]|nr:M1 family metallopeptidase [Chloroflexota bacterium]
MLRKFWIMVIGIVLLTAVGCSRGAPTSQPPVVEPQPDVQETPALSAEATQSSRAASAAGQAAAMLAQAQADLPALRNAPHYAIQLEVDYAGHAFRGAQQATITNTESAAWESLFFRLLPNGGKSYGNGSLTVTSMAINGAPAETKLSLQNTILEAALPGPLNPGERVEISFEFSGKVPQDFGETGYGIYNVSEGVMALSAFYPMLAVYDQDGWNLDAPSYVGDSVFSDIGFFTVDVTVPSEALLVATGVEVSRQEQDGRAVHRLVSGPVREFFLILSPDFQSVTAHVDGTAVHSYYLPGQDEGGQMVLDASVASLKLANERFGVYPYTEMDVLSAPMANALGVEFPGVMLVASDLYEELDSDFITSVAAHEVAHQWWYNLVGNDVFEEPWVDEALCTYFSGLYFEEMFGGQGYQGYQSYLQGRVDKLREEGKDDVVTKPLVYFEQPDTALIYGRVVYSKGALFYYTLREEIGEEAFFAA